MRKRMLFFLLIGLFLLFYSYPIKAKQKYKKELIVIATAYCDGYITSTGSSPRIGTISVDPKIIPYGTKIYIPELKLHGKAEDCGGNIIGYRIDIYHPDRDWCNNWGVKEIKILVDR